MSRIPKLLFYDLEVSRDIVAGYGNHWEFKVVKTIQHQQLMSFSFKFQGDKKISHFNRHDFKTYKAFVTKLWELLDEADIAVAHNAKQFDNRMANRFFIEQGFSGVSPYRTVDTLLVARSEFKFPGNSLNQLSEFLGIGKKEKITYADLEDDFMSDKPSRKTLRLMRAYNNKDVVLLEGVYDRMLPYMKNHPNMSVLSDRPDSCPRCLATTGIQSRGTIVSNSTVYREFRCTSCRGPIRLRLQDIEHRQDKSLYVNV